MSFLHRVLWVNTKPYNQMSIDTAVTCVVKGSMVDMLVKCTNAYILVNICPHAIYVIRHSLIRVFGIKIRLCIPGKLHIILENISVPVLFLINHSLGRVVWRDNVSYILGNMHIGVKCVTNYAVSIVIWRLISAHVLKNVHIHVMDATYSFRRVVWRDIMSYILGNIHVGVKYVINYLV